MKAYKGFLKDMTCVNGFQYEEGKTYEEKIAVLCSKGFHACLRPFDVFRYYSPFWGDIFHEVELDYVCLDKGANDSKIVGKKITIGKELTIDDMINAQIETLRSEASPNLNDIIVSNSDWANIDISHRLANVYAYGEWQSITLSSRGVSILTTGRMSTVNSIGSDSIIVSTERSWIQSIGFEARIFSLGDRSTISSSGLCAMIFSSGDFAQITSSGDESRIRCCGKNSVVSCTGRASSVMGVLGTSIVFFDIDSTKKIKTAVIDGENYMPDVFYTLREEKIVEDSRFTEIW